MLQLYLLWIVVVFGGFYVGGGAVWHLLHGGFDWGLLLNAVLYLGCALYGVPRFVRLLRGQVTF